MEQSLFDVNFTCFYVKFVLQRHERNIKGRNQLVKKFAEEYHFTGNVALLDVALHFETAVALTVSKSRCTN